MPKSYKICPVEHFDSSKFGNNRYSLRPQLPIPGFPQGPETHIRLSYDVVQFDDFRSYLIEHERVVKQRGRFGDQSFMEYIRTGDIDAHYSKSRDLLLLCGKKDDILDLCKVASNAAELRFTTISINMNALLEKLAEVRLVWFRFADGKIHASALMGTHIERTEEFKEAKSLGDISTLSFYVDDGSGLAHPVQVTSDGAVVLQSVYREKATEIELVLHVKKLLLDGTYEVVPLKQARRQGTND